MNVVDSSLLDEGDPAFDQRAFRRALGQFATGVTVITTKAGDELCRRHGQLVLVGIPRSSDGPLVASEGIAQPSSIPAVGSLRDQHPGGRSDRAWQATSPGRRQTSSRSRAWREGIGGIPLINQPRRSSSAAEPLNTKQATTSSSLAKWSISAASTGLASSSRKGVMRLPSITPARLLIFLFRSPPTPGTIFSFRCWCAAMPICPAPSPSITMPRASTPTSLAFWPSWQPAPARPQRSLPA